MVFEFSNMKINLGLTHEHQGSAVEKSIAQKLNQGEWTNVLNIICP